MAEVIAENIVSMAKVYRGSAKVVMVGRSGVAPGNALAGPTNTTQYIKDR